MNKFVKALIAVVIVAAVATGAYFIWFNKPATKPTPAVEEVVETTTPETVDEVTDTTANG